MIWLAGCCHGSWGGPTKYHAVDVETREPVAGRFRSRCGQRYVSLATGRDGEPVAFGSVLHLEQCGTCVRLLRRSEVRS